LNIELFHQETQAVCPPLLLERAGEAAFFFLRKTLYSYKSKKRYRNDSVLLVINELNS